MAATKTKKPKRKSPTARALADLRAMGFEPWVVESRIPRTFITRDAFGFADILAMRPGVGILLLQVTGGTGGNHSNRRQKCYAEPRLRTWLLSGGRFEVWSYPMRGKVGEQVIALRREEITLADLDAEPVEDVPPLFEVA